MNEEINSFEEWCKSSWGKPTREHKELLDTDTPRVLDAWCFSSISPSLKVHIAEKLILESCSHMGAIMDTGDVSWYIYKFGREFQGKGIGFNGRRAQPIKAALLLITQLQFTSVLPADRNDLDHIRAGGGAMAAMYLLAQIEFLCRVKGHYLSGNGTVIHPIPEQLRNKANTKKNQKRVNRVNQAFTLYLYRNRSILARRLRSLDTNLNIGKRIDIIRNPVMHGELADPSSEANFFALLIAMFYYSDIVG